jgi:hypothetical protein
VLLRSGMGASWVVTRRNPDRAMELPAGFYRWNDGMLVGALAGEQYVYDVTNDMTQRTDVPQNVLDTESTYEIMRTTGTNGLILVDQTKEDVHFSLPSGEWYFGPAYNGTLFLQRDGEWIGFNPDDKQPVAHRIMTAEELQSMRISGDTHLLSRYEGEIWVMKLGEDPQLIMRKSAPVLDVAWHRRGNHIFYATDRDIIVLELDERDHRLETTLASFDEVTGMTVARRIVYISGNIGEKQGIFSLEVE